MAGRKRGMPAKHHCKRRCESAQFVIGVAGSGYEKGGFGQIVFGGDRLENGIVQPAVQRDDRGGIARERAIGKGINLGEIGDYHVRSVSRSRPSGGSRYPFGSGWLRPSVTGKDDASFSSPSSTT